MGAQHWLAIRRVKVCLVVELCRAVPGSYHDRGKPRGCQARPEQQWCRHFVDWTCVALQSTVVRHPACCFILFRSFTILSAKSFAEAGPRPVAVRSFKLASTSISLHPTVLTSCSRFTLGKSAGYSMPEMVCVRVLTLFRLPLAHAVSASATTLCTRTSSTRSCGCSARQ